MHKQLKTFLRLKQLIPATGMSRSWIYEAMRRGKFPKSVSLGPRAVGWDTDAVAAWQEQRIQHGENSVQPASNAGELWHEDRN